jgi:uncharacterized membrane protein YwaF
MKEFFGFGGYTRQAEGFLSWQHLTFVTALMAVMVLLAVALGRKNRSATMAVKNRVLIATALLIDGIELFKILILCLRSESWSPIRGNLPLFLCSIQLISIPMAAFCKGRLRIAALDFVAIFGLLGAVAGTYGAGQNYGCYPVLSLDNVASGLTHSISGFAALYILISRMASLEKRDIPVTCGILSGFCLGAWIANTYLDTNYMFLVRGDGTPYDILLNLVGGHPVFYPLCVIALFFLYITGFYCICFYTRKKAKAH